MDIANFIEQFEDQLDSSFNGENIQIKEVSNETTIRVILKIKFNLWYYFQKIASDELVIKKNQTAKKTVSDAAISSHYMIPGRKVVKLIYFNIFWKLTFYLLQRLNEVFKKKKVDKVVESNKRPPVFKHVALQRSRVCLLDIEKMLAGPEMDINKLTNSLKALEEKFKV
jgi:hypothetical protein